MRCDARVTLSRDKRRQKRSTQQEGMARRRVAADNLSFWRFSVCRQNDGFAVGLSRLPTKRGWLSDHEGLKTTRNARGFAVGLSRPLAVGCHRVLPGGYEK